MSEESPELVRRTETVTIYPGDAAKRTTELRDQIDAALEARAQGPRRMVEQDDPDLLALAAEHDAAAEEAAKGIEVTVGEVSFRRQRELMGEAGEPRPDEAEDALYGYNRWAFEVALVHESWISPDWPADRIDRLAEQGSARTYGKVLNAVLRANDTEVEVPKAFAVSALQALSGSTTKPDAPTE